MATLVATVTDCSACAPLTACAEQIVTRERHSHPNILRNELGMTDIQSVSGGRVMSWSDHWTRITAVADRALRARPASSTRILERGHRRGKRNGEQRRQGQGVTGHV